MRELGAVELSILTRKFGEDATQLLCPVDGEPGPVLPGMLEVVLFSGFNEYAA